MCSRVKIGALFFSLYKSASWTRLMLPCDRILMSHFVISVSSVPNSIEEELQTELELSRFALSVAGSISDNCPVVIARWCGNALDTPPRNDVFFLFTPRSRCFEAALQGQSCRLPSLLLRTHVPSFTDSDTIMNDPVLSDPWHTH